VIATARNVKRMQDLVDSADFEAVELDVSDAGSISRAVERVSAITGGKLDVLVNCAGGAYHARPAIELGTPDDLVVFDLNFHAAVRMVTALAPLLIAAGAAGGARTPRAQVVNIGSVAGALPVPYLGMYCAAKAALVAYGDTLRVELSPFGVGVMTVVTGTIANSKTIAQLELKLAPNSPYKPLEELFYKTFKEANADPTTGAEYARNVVAEVLRAHPRYVWWTGKQATLAWLLVTFLPRFIPLFILSRMWGLHTLTAQTRRKNT